MKTCFSTLGCHDLELNQILKIANKYNIDAIEVRGIHHEMSNNKIEAFKNIKDTYELFKNSNVVPYILGTSCKFHDDTTRDSMIEKAYEEIQIASRNHFYGIRVFGNLIIDSTTIYKVIDSLNKICKYALDYKIHIFLEVHGDFNTIESLKEIVNHINYDNFSLIWDIYHTHFIYQNNWKEFYHELKNHITHVHIKDVLDKKIVLPGKGEIDIVGIIQYLIDDGYTGYFSLEWERKWEPDLEPIEIALENYIRLLEVIHE